jgi:glucokinase
MAKRRRRREYWIGFDLGGTKMLAAVLDGKFRIVASRRRKTKAGDGGAGKGVARVAETIDQALAEAGIARADLAGIGIGVPAYLDLNRGVVLHAPNLNWTRVPIRKRLEKAFGVPVVVANDVDAGTYGEYRFGAAREARCVVGIFPGTGIGGACIYQGRVLRGARSSCMEIGHIPVERGGRLCGCGRRGCLESVASRLAIAGEVAQAACRGEAPYVLRNAGTDAAEIRSGLLRAAIEAGDKAVEGIVRHAARHIGWALAGVVNLLAPDVVVLGGGLVEEMPRLFREEIEAAMRAQVIEPFRDTTRLAVAELGDQATVMGAAALAAEPAALA